MGLNIKNERVHELAREAARRTGRTQTGAIQLALEKLLADTEPKRQVQAKRRRMDVVLRDIDLVVTGEVRDAVLGELAGLYDERGMPR